MASEAAPEAPAEPTPAPAEVAPPAPPAPSGPPAVLLKGVQAGDAACYLEVESAGSPQTLMADFELCPGGGQDLTGRIGQSVHLETRKENVMADSCQGDPECTETKEVELVVAAH